MTSPEHIAARVAEMTHYEVLGVEAVAPQPAVERAGRMSLQDMHDAVHNGPIAERRVRFMGLLRVREAYLALRDPARRRAYDAWLTYDVADPLGSTTVPRQDSALCPVCGRTVRFDDAGSTIIDAVAARPGLAGPAA